MEAEEGFWISFLFWRNLCLLKLASGNIIRERLFC